MREHGERQRVGDGEEGQIELHAIEMVMNVFCSGGLIRGLYISGFANFSQK